MPREQRIVNFSGSVQGVGFRYTACRTATDFAVKGTVCNLPDGRVECVIEGEKAEIDAFLNQLEVRMSGCIRDRTEATAPCSDRYEDFRVRY
jgi:acylphosphatase